ncbi:MAG TPA: hypothetical protein VHB54_12125 [Mucilaginibacter sp.]|nr:hypothetical protein [Mucilaginibacter sp.]
MTTLMITVEDEKADQLKKLLQGIDFVKSIETQETGEAKELREPATAYDRLKKIQEEIGDKELFKDIKDPSEWQREIRKEWDRDF